MTATRHAVTEPEAGRGGPAAGDRVAPESMCGLRLSAFVGALIAGGMAWFGLLRVVAWVV